MRENKHFDVKKISLNIDNKFAQNLKFFEQAILPYTDTIEIGFDSEIERNQFGR